jgi:hypothetical protein
LLLPPGGDALDAHDVVFWLGDLNYRINGNGRVVRHLMRSRLHEVLHANDQLRLQQRKGLVFQVRVCVTPARGAQRCWAVKDRCVRARRSTERCCCCCLRWQGFEEGRIHFPPTFKFVPGSSAYSNQRVPSWTDRVLWKVNARPSCGADGSDTTSASQGVGSTGGGDATVLLPAAQSGPPPPPDVVQLYYNAVQEVVSSDHKPVVAGFLLSTGAEAEATGSCDNGCDASAAGDGPASCCRLM